jgi:L-alanine-DL-glutamate epimerase-like enolase superfamily enzyme
MPNMDRITRIVITPVAFHDLPLLNTVGVQSPFEVALLDIQGRTVDRPVSDPLGGAVRDRTAYSGYPFYTWHRGAPRLSGRSKPAIV